MDFRTILSLPQSNIEYVELPSFGHLRKRGTPLLTDTPWLFAVVRALNYDETPMALQQQRVFGTIA